MQSHPRMLDQVTQARPDSAVSSGHSRLHIGLDGLGSVRMRNVTGFPSIVSMAACGASANACWGKNVAESSVHWVTAGVAPSPCCRRQSVSSCSPSNLLRADCCLLLPSSCSPMGDGDPETMEESPRKKKKKKKKAGATAGGRRGWASRRPEERQAPRCCCPRVQQPHAICEWLVSWSPHGYALGEGLGTARVCTRGGGAGPHGYALGEGVLGSAQAESSASCI